MDQRSSIPGLPLPDAARGGVQVVAALIAIIGSTSGCAVGSGPAVTAGSTASPPSASASESSSAGRSRTPPPVPTVGECRYVADAWFSQNTDYSRVTACDVEHSAETIWVGEVTGPEAEQEVPDYLVVAEDTACGRRLTEHFGTSDWMATRLTPKTFVAPLDQWRLGARWVRCDVYLLEDGDNKYGRGDPLFAPVRVDEATLRALQFCATYDPDTPDSAVSVDCSQAHNFEAITPTLDLGELGETFPGDDDVSAAAGEHCPAAVSEFIGGLPAEVQYIWLQPDEELWELGDRVIVCGVEVIGGRVAGSLRGGGEQVEVIPFAEG